MREVKFRVWDIPNKSFLPVMLADGFSLWQLNSEVVGNDYRFKFQEYTGLTDKNGKEIYEGDIVKIHKVENDDMWGGPRMGFIEWQSAWFTVNCGGTDVTINQGYDAYSSHLEVIGNIYENPELLQPPKQESN